MSKITLVNQVPEDVENMMNKELVDYEQSHKIDINYNRFSLLLEDNNKIIGVLNAYTAFTEIYIDDLWIACDKRASGFGKELLTEVERMFKDKGYNNINLVTNEFQAPKFYEKCGFSLEFVRKNIYNPKLSKYFYIKYFNDTNQSQGTIL